MVMGTVDALVKRLRLAGDFNGLSIPSLEISSDFLTFEALVLSTLKASWSFLCQLGRVGVGGMAALHSQDAVTKCSAPWTLRSLLRFGSEVSPKAPVLWQECSEVK